MTQNNEREVITNLALECGLLLKTTNLDLCPSYLTKLEAFAKACKAQNEQQPKQMPDGWISVKDRLPEKYTEVLVYPQPNEYTHCASYGKFKNKQIDDGWFYGEYEAGIGHENYTCKVTHWMPLPTAPTNTEVGE